MTNFENSNLTFEDYQIQARKFAVYPKIGDSWIYPVLGLSGETGELCEKIKKIYRDKDGEFAITDIDNIKKELGDILWYVSALANEFDIPLEDIANTNIEKLSSRHDRGVLQGSGDNR
jgi:NTP pyrophosphatase (non-canonical NTP hydrolase)